MATLTSGNPESHRYKKTPTDAPSRKEGLWKPVTYIIMMLTRMLPLLFYTWHGVTSWKGDWLFSEAWDRMRTELRFHGDKRETLGWSASLDFRGQTHIHTVCPTICQAFSRSEFNLRLCERLWGRDRNEKKGKDRRDRRTEGRVHRQGDVTANWMFILG